MCTPVSDVVCYFCCRRFIWWRIMTTHITVTPLWSVPGIYSTKWTLIRTESCQRKNLSTAVSTTRRCIACWRAQTRKQTQKNKQTILDTTWKYVGRWRAQTRKQTQKNKQTILDTTWKYVGRYTSLNHNTCIYVTADPNPVDVEHAAHAYRCIGRLKCSLSES